MRSDEIKAGLDHPVIDVDGHLQDVTPLLRDEVMDRARLLGGTRLAERVAAVPLTYDEGARARWFGLSDAERREQWAVCPAWWAMPTATLDRATAYLPGLLHERLGEMGIDFSVLYPSLGLSLVGIADDEVRRLACRVYNDVYADLFRPYADRLTPVAVLPTVTPAEAVDELDHAVGELAAKAVAIGHVRRAVPGAGLRLDTYGVDSAYDYNPLWRRCTELGVALGVHASDQAWGSRRSISNYTYNHIGCFAASGESMAKSLVLGGVTARFPSLRFAFLEGGVGWARTLLADLIGHWEKRNGAAILGLDPDRLDLDGLGTLFGRYGPGRLGDVARVREFFARPDPHPAQLDDFAAAHIERVEDFVARFVEPFFFGCEADDPINAWAFRPPGPRLQAVLGSDIGHWDVPRLDGVLEEAYEPVERGELSEADFRDLVFANPVRLYGPRFFEGTSCEAAVRKEVAAA
ncbi:MAG TPA: amidohydrolase family protein [Acidimicrobiales bacterium]|nr:amidohydrolase family protein [Acidimicrobiales bacterium]